MGGLLRDGCSVSSSSRLELYLKFWLLGYYTVTFSLEVMVKLANLLVEKLETALSIDWDQVTGFKEFSGHTAASLTKLFHEDLMLATVKHFKTLKSNLTLKQIAEVAKIKYGDEKKVPDKLMKRQGDIIEYWEGLS